jgi:hypothetical protein
MPITASTTTQTPSATPARTPAAKAIRVTSCFSRAIQSVVLVRRIDDLARLVDGVTALPETAELAALE